MEVVFNRKLLENLCAGKERWYRPRDLGPYKEED